MANYQQKKSSGLWVWIIIAIIVATIAVATLYYIGWFDNNTHVDTPAGDNVEQQYVLDEAGADDPGEADWQMPTEGRCNRLLPTPSLKHRLRPNRD